MVQKCPVVNSRLWKSLRKGLSKGERAKLLRELRKVYEADKLDGLYFELDAPILAAAFLWKPSPQGWEFWQNEHLAHTKRLTVLK